MVYIILVNHNSWQHTVECLQSISRTEYKHFKVIVCDNGSTDDSWSKIMQWALNEPGTTCIGEGEKCPEGRPAEKPGSVMFIKSKTNKGFAGGVNVALKISLLDPECNYMWALNNDTIIDPAALRCLVREMEEDEGIGMCGSTVLYYDEPHAVQALGGSSFNKYLGITKYVGNGLPDNTWKHIDKNYVLEKLECLAGASMFLRRSMIEEVGFFSEEYFLYYEEMDYAHRIKGRYRLGYAPDSIVYHKEGASTGGSRKNLADKSRVADYYSLKNKLVFTRKYYPRHLPTVYLSLALSIALRVVRGQYDRVPMIIRLIFNKNAGC